MASRTGVSSARGCPLFPRSLVTCFKIFNPKGPGTPNAGSAVQLFFFLFVFRKRSRGVTSQTAFSVATTNRICKFPRSRLVWPQLTHSEQHHLWSQGPVRHVYVPEVTYGEGGSVSPVYIVHLALTVFSQLSYPRPAKQEAVHRSTQEVRRHSWGNSPNHGT